MSRKKLNLFSAIIFTVIIAFAGSVSAQDMHHNMMKDSTKSKTHKMMKMKSHGEIAKMDCSGCDMKGSDSNNCCKENCKCDNKEMKKEKMNCCMKGESDKGMKCKMKDEAEKDSCCNKEGKEGAADCNMKEMQGKADMTEAPAQKIWNKVCPVRGEEVDSESPTVEYNGKLIGFCCPGCDAKFQKEPEKYMKNLSEDGSKFIGTK